MIGVSRIHSRPFVDAHVHLFDRDLHRWLTNEKPPTFEGDWTPIIGDYTLDAYLSDVGASMAQLLGFVHIEAGAHDPHQEAAAVERLAGKAAVPVSIVGGVDLSKPSAQVQGDLDALMRTPSLHGVRQILNTHVDPLYNYVDVEYMDHPTWLANLGLLAGRGLSFDMQLYPTQFGRALQVIDANPNVVFIIDHAGMWADRHYTGWRQWRSGLAEIGKRDNVAVKISGLVSLDHNWTMNSLKPIMYTCLESFGIERCMLATNFPVDKLHSTYDELTGAYISAAEGLPDDEQDALFATNAQRYYHLNALR